MEQKNTKRNLLVFLALFSLFAFVAVNMHASHGQILGNAPKTEKQIDSKMENPEQQDVKMPEISTLGKVLSVAQKLLSLSF